jgi:hypothetical protein
VSGSSSTTSTAGLFVRSSSVAIAPCRPLPFRVMAHTGALSGQSFDRTAQQDVCRICLAWHVYGNIGTFGNARAQDVPFVAAGTICLLTTPRLSG